jgi:peptidoglycan/xylan/chitin deacetylase (PgdA/CDA1 family)
MRRQASRRRQLWIVAGVLALVAVGTAGGWAGVRTFASGGHAAHAAPAVRGRRRSSSATTTSTSATTTTSTTLPATPVAIQGGPTAPVVSRVPTPNPVVFFTIDDGQVRDPAVIDFLREHQIPVTIFPIPAYVQQDPSYFDAIHTLGASVQDHTLTHPDLRRLAPGEQQRQICGPLDDYAARFGARPWLFRPPFGDLSPSVPGIARRCGIRAVVLWRATMNDGRIDIQGGRLQPGDIILMHFRRDLRQNLEVALDAARSAGLHPAPLEQYLTP